MRGRIIHINTHKRRETGKQTLAHTPMMMIQYKAALAIRKFQSRYSRTACTQTHTQIHKHTQNHSVPPDHPFKQPVKCYQHDKLQKVKNVSLTINVSPPS